MIRHMSLAGALVTMLLASQASAAISSYFTTSDEGWTTVSLFDGGDGNPNWSQSHHTESPGYIQFNEPSGDRNGDWEWFKAPSTFNGNLAAYEDEDLHIRLRVAGGSIGAPVTFVILATDQQYFGQNFYLYYSTNNAANAPGSAWTDYTIPLTAYAGFGQWYYMPYSVDGTLQSNVQQPNTNSLAEQQQLQAALSSITGFYVNADYVNGPETTGLDFVVLGETPNPPSEIPEPGSIILFGLCSLGLFGGCYRRRFKGAAVA
jgi:hypothetical protein